MTTDVIIHTLPCANGYKVGHIVLNRPKALNALSQSMAEAIMTQLTQWQNDEALACVVISGEGDRAFCAGGDIQAMYHAMQKNPGGEAKETETFFACEYHMDYALHQFTKPLIAWGNGVVMGGGMGIFMACDFRVVSANARLAMPEITIGLYPDVGASYFLNTLPDNIGRFLALTGSISNASDSLALSLATHHCAHATRDTLLEQLTQQSWSGNNEKATSDIQTLLLTLDQENPEPLPASQLINTRDIIKRIFSEADTRQLIDNFLSLDTNEAWLQHAQANVRNGSPLSALLIDAQYQRAQGKTLLEVFKMDMLLSTNIVRFTELSEGIRALLIDKDKSPQWAYKTHKDIPQSVVDSFFNAPWETNPLDDVV